MLRIIYITILVCFVFGGVGSYLINRNKDPGIARKSYTEFGVYFIIVNILFFSITSQPLVFHFLAVLIIWAGCIELCSLFFKSKCGHISFFISSIIVFLVFALWFLLFSFLKKELTLFTFLILSVFDNFSRITGRLGGYKKVMPNISPDKTLGGLAGGTIISLISAFLLKNLFGGSIAELFFFTGGIVVFAFLGDILSSLFRRKYKVKNFNNVIPGHGGFLDRFDSLIAGGAWAALYFQFIAP